MKITTGLACRRQQPRRIDIARDSAAKEAPTMKNRMKTDPFLGLCLFIFGACSSGGGPDSRPGLDGGGHLADAPRAPSGKYVAMGSSFAAGPSVPDLVVGQACFGSTGNYAHLVASDLALELVDVTCSGATIDNLTSVAQGVNPPQIEGMT
jgi:hypothetical protein